MRLSTLSLLGIFLLALGIAVTVLQALALHYLQSQPVTQAVSKYITYRVAFFTTLRAENGSSYTLMLNGSYMRVELLPNGSYVIHLNGTAVLEDLEGGAVEKVPINVTAVVPKGDPLAQLLVLPQNAKYAEVDGYQFPLYFSSSGTFAAFRPSQGYYELAALVPGESVDAYYVKLGNSLVLAELNDEVLNSTTHGVGSTFLGVLEQSPFVKGVTVSLYPDEPTLSLYGVSTNLGLSSVLAAEFVSLPIGLLLIVGGTTLLYLSRIKRMLR